jgi:hypothetical protein
MTQPKAGVNLSIGRTIVWLFARNTRLGRALLGTDAELQGLIAVAVRRAYQNNRAQAAQVGRDVQYDDGKLTVKVRVGYSRDHDCYVTDILVIPRFNNPRGSHQHVIIDEQGIISIMRRQENQTRLSEEDTVFKGFLSSANDLLAKRPEYMRESEQEPHAAKLLGLALVLEQKYPNLFKERLELIEITDLASNLEISNTDSVSLDWRRIRELVGQLA